MVILHAESVETTVVAEFVNEGLTIKLKHPFTRVVSKFHLVHSLIPIFKIVYKMRTLGESPRTQHC